MSKQLIQVNIPGRVAYFWTGGQSFVDYQSGLKPDQSQNLDQGEYELFDTVANTRRRRAGKGHFYTVRLTKAGLEALKYWAETMETASGDDASWDPDAKLDLNAARKALGNAKLALAQWRIP
jgi:hypothetical protein